MEIISVPVPTGPLVTAPVLLTPMISVPAFRLKPLVKVFAPLRTSAPAPVLLIAPPASG